MWIISNAYNIIFAKKVNGNIKYVCKTDKYNIILHRPQSFYLQIPNEAIAYG